MGAVVGVVALMAVRRTVTASSADGDMPADADTRVAAVDFTVEQPAVAEGSMVEGDPTVVVDTVAGVDMGAADTGKFVRGLI
jgi:hypothetical protein